MNDRLFWNLLKILLSYLLYYSGISLVFLRFLRKEPGLYIFNYHNFSTLRNHFWKFGSLFKSDYSANFERQLRFFQRHLKPLVDFDIDRISQNGSLFLLTFDDGYRDNYQVALPLLERYQTPVIFFITTSVIGTQELLWHDRIGYHYEKQISGGVWAQSAAKGKLKKELADLKSVSPGEKARRLADYPSRGRDRLMMNWDEVKEADKKGILIGAHTHTHPILSKIHEKEQALEIDLSLKTFNAYLKKRPLFFAYPDGTEDSFDTTTINLLKERGFSYAMTTVPGINTHGTGPSQLRRIGTNPSDSVPVLALKMMLAFPRSRSK